MKLDKNTDSLILDEVESMMFETLVRWANEEVVRFGDPRRAMRAILSAITHDFCIELQRRLHVPHLFSDVENQEEIAIAMSQVGRTLEALIENLPEEKKAGVQLQISMELYGLIADQLENRNEEDQSAEGSVERQSP